MLGDIGLVVGESVGLTDGFVVGDVVGDCGLVEGFTLGDVDGSGVVGEVVGN